MSKKLASFVVENEQYTVYGNYTMETGTNFESKEYLYPEFHELTAAKTVDGKEIDYTPSGESWNGCKYSALNMISDFLMHTIIGNSYYKPEYIESGLKDFIDFYTKEDEIEMEVSGMKIPKKVLSHDMYVLYQLAVVTDKFIYYTSEDQMIMLSAESHNLVSDNYFAEVGFYESVENIKKGTEKLLWGELPEEV